MIPEMFKNEYKGDYINRAMSKIIRQPEFRFELFNTMLEKCGLEWERQRAEMRAKQQSMCPEGHVAKIIEQNGSKYVQCFVCDKFYPK